MAHLRSGRRLTRAAPVVLSPTASPGFVPAATSAAPRAAGARQAEGSSTLTYVVNTRTDRRTISDVQRAITDFYGPGIVNALRAVK
ncbi:MULTISPECIES: hypothetical protein [Streptomyces]|uniref:hypothetical protein n=1 Tax=Streptomyces TaxID=1883 RepID=UPI001928E0E3|nr:hypothetical protein [Streptomyces sp. SID2888]